MLVSGRCVLMVNWLTGLPKCRLRLASGKLTFSGLVHSAGGSQRLLPLMRPAAVVMPLSGSSLVAVLHSDVRAVFSFTHFPTVGVEGVAPGAHTSSWMQPMKPRVSQVMPSPARVTLVRSVVV